MLRKFAAIFLSLTLCWTTVACGSSEQIRSGPGSNNNVAATPQAPLTDGKYPVQQATYNDADGEYTLMLLNTPPGTPPVFRSANLQMARLTDDQIAKGEKTYLDVKSGQAAMYLTEDFKIEYVHNVTEAQTNPQTGQSETVVVRQESSFWTPFAGALAGQAIGSLLFRPQYYMPPVYQPGGILRGYGGYGNSYGQAVERYQTRHNTPPPAVRNRQTLRTTGNIRRTPSTSTNTFRRQAPSSSRSSGSGYGSNRLGSSGRSSSPGVKSRSSFGSSGSRIRSRSSFGGRSRRR